MTEASRNFADCVSRVRYQGAIFVLQKNGVPVARIVPVQGKSAAGLESAAAPTEDKLTHGETVEQLLGPGAASEGHTPIAEKWSRRSTEIW